MMLAVDAAITRVRRDLTLSVALRFGLGFAAAACMLLVGTERLRWLGLLAIAAIWMWLSVNSARGSRSAAASPSLIAAGNFEEAERNIEQTVRTFSLFRTVKLQALHHLALLRHAQRRWQDSAALSRALLGHRLGTLQPISRTARLLLADALLEMNDLRGAHEALLGLAVEPLPLAEAMNRLSVELDYLARIGAWESMMQGIMSKVQVAELMPAASSARAQAMLALAARKSGREDFAAWLIARAELLADVEKLVADRPVLRELWAKPQAESPT